MQMRDSLVLDSPRRDSAGNMVASVLAARVGVQDYAGYEVGKPELARVAVYRPASEVFSRDSMKSFAGAPVTIGHPDEAVTPSNWKDHAVGEADQEIVRDGEAVRVPFMLRDAGGIASVEGGLREISMGYTSELVWGDGTAPDGTAFNATQTNIRINHLAIVDRARGGPTLRIGDSEMTTKTITFDGLPLLVTDAAEAAIGKLQKIIADRDASLATADTTNATLTKTIGAKDGEIAVLTKAVAGAAVTPEKLATLVADRAKVIADAKKIAGVALITDGKSDADIRKAAVTAKLGDAAKDMSDAAIDGAFNALAAIGVKDGVRDVLRDGIITTGDAAADYVADRDKRKAALSDAWRAPATAAA